MGQLALKFKSSLTQALYSGAVFIIPNITINKSHRYGLNTQPAFEYASQLKANQKWRRDIVEPTRFTTWHKKGKKRIFTCIIAMLLSKVTASYDGWRIICSAMILFWADLKEFVSLSK